MNDPMRPAPTKSTLPPLVYPKGASLVRDTFMPGAKPNSVSRPEDSPPRREVKPRK